MLNLLLVGPSGIGKSTAIRLGFNLLRDNLEPHECPAIISDAATPEALHDELVQSPHAVVFAEEMATLFGKQRYMEAMVPYVTRLLDYPPFIGRTLKSSGKLIIRNPAVSVVAGSTKDWLQDMLPDTAATGGFLPRFLIVKEDRRGQRVSNPRESLSPRAAERLERHRAETFANFRRLVLGAPEGRIQYADYSAADAYAGWYSNHRALNSALEPFASRAPEWITRLSLLAALSCGRAAVDESDILYAVSLYSYFETKLAEVIQPFTPRGRLLLRVKETLPFEPTKRTLVLRKLQPLGTAREMDEFINSLVATGDAEQDAHGNVWRKEG